MSESLASCLAYTILQYNFPHYTLEQLEAERFCSTGLVAVRWRALSSKSVVELQQLAEASRRYDRTLLPVGEGEVVVAETTWAHYANLSALSVSEMVALALGYDPAQVIWVFAVGSHRQSYAVEMRVERAVVMGELKNFTRPADFVRWCKGRLVLPEAFVDAVSKVPVSATSELVEARERSKLLGILLAIAMQSFGYDPDRKKNSTAEKIAAVTELAGLSSTAETINKYLKEAVNRFLRKTAPIDRLVPD